MPLCDLIVDMDCFFASVEQQIHPELRGKPIAIVPVVSDFTCCIAASKEAKKYGVKTGTGALEARQKCPEIKLMESTPMAYLEFHQRFLTALQSCAPVAAVLSIDEAWCHLPVALQKRPEAERLARKIKATVKDHLGEFVTCSIGIAPNRFLAKLASDMGKPDGLFFIESKDLPHCLHALKLRDFCGIGRNMEQRLKDHGIHTVSQLTAASHETLHRVWGGIGGSHMWHWLRGEVTELPPTQKRVIGHSHVLPLELRNEEGAHAVNHRLIQKAAMRMRKTGYFAAGLAFFIKSRDHPTWSDDITFTETQDTFLFLKAFETLWKRCPARYRHNPKATGITLFHLMESDKVTPSLLPVDPRHEKLNTIVDSINRSFGKNTIYLGGAHGSLEYTPMRIAFTRIPDAETEG